MPVPVKKPSTPSTPRAPRVARVKKVAASPAIEDVEITPPLQPSSPELKKNLSGKRQRLSKIFSRPLDKKLRKKSEVRERSTFPASEHAQLLSLKKQLLEQGLIVKKSELVRAGLMLLAALDAENLKATLLSLADAE